MTFSVSVSTSVGGIVSSGCVSATPVSEAPAPGPLFGERATAWLANRVGNRESTNYRNGYYLRTLEPFFEKPIASITTESIRAWYEPEFAKRPSTAAKSYSMLRSILQEAWQEGLIVRNPATLRGAGSFEPPERPIISLQEIDSLAWLMPPRLRLVVLLAGYCQLRHGEIMALRRKDLDLDEAVVHIVRTTSNGYRSRPIINPPKTRSSIRTVSIPAHIMPDVLRHLAYFTGPELDAALITGMRTSDSLGSHTWKRHWSEARDHFGRPDLHLHDLRHSGATAAASTGLPVRDLMARLGHSTPAMAIHYQHRVPSHDRHVADALTALAEGGTEAGWRR